MPIESDLPPRGTSRDGGAAAPATAANVVRRFWALMADNDFAAVGAVLADDFLLEWPQSGERIRGRGDFARMNSQYPAQGRWTFAIDRLFGDETQAVSDVRVSDGVRHDRALSFFTVREGRIARIVEYWPEPFEPAPNRAHLVDKSAG
jgi:ketosteroid isomerase-like protein